MHKCKYKQRTTSCTISSNTQCKQTKINTQMYIYKYSMQIHKYKYSMQMHKNKCNQKTKQKLAFSTEITTTTGCISSNTQCKYKNRNTQYKQTIVNLFHQTMTKRKLKISISFINPSHKKKLASLDRVKWINLVRNGGSFEKLIL